MILMIQYRLSGWFQFYYKIETIFIKIVCIIHNEERLHSAQEGEEGSTSSTDNPEA
jgi:hypothetical protein